MTARVRVAALLTVLLAGASPPACRNGGPSGGAAPPVVAPAPTVVLQTSDARTIAVRVELARTEDERARGLMYRNHLEPDAGMLFLFPRPSALAFWMKNTLIPLDMLFMDHDRRIIGIVENAAPETETPRRVDGDAEFVLEIGGGLARRWGVTPGSTAEFRGLPGGVEAR